MQSNNNNNNNEGDEANRLQQQGSHMVDLGLDVQHVNRGVTPSEVYSASMLNMGEAAQGTDESDVDFGVRLVQLLKRGSVVVSPSRQGASGQVAQENW